MIEGTTVLGREDYAFPSINEKDYGNLVATTGGYLDQDNVDYNPNSIWVSVLDDDKPCKCYVDKLIATINKINYSKIPYQFRADRLGGQRTSPEYWTGASPAASRLHLFTACRAVV